VANPLRLLTKDGQENTVMNALLMKTLTALTQTQLLLNAEQLRKPSLNIRVVSVKSADTINVCVLWSFIMSTQTVRILVFQRL
jgi:hypothetical protein